MLATITNTNIDIARTAIKIFIKLGLMEQLDDGTIYMNEIQQMIGCETEWAEKKRVYRESQKLLPQTSEGHEKTMSDKSLELELEKEKEKEIEIKKEKDKDKKRKESMLQKFCNDSFEILAVDYLISKILILNPNAKLPITLEDKQKWAIHIDSMKRLDNRAEDDIKRVLKFAAEDSFWQKNILSTKKFRDKYDTLYIQMKSKKQPKESSNVFMEIGKEEGLF